MTRLIICKHRPSHTSLPDDEICRLGGDTPGQAIRAAFEFLGQPSPESTEREERELRTFGYVQLPSLGADIFEWEK